MLIEQTLFVVTLLLPWTVFAANKKFFHGKHAFFFAIASVVFVYGTLMLLVNSIDIRLERELNTFDLNGDGVFSGTEINPAQEAAMAALVNDTGRNMAPITGAVFAALYTAITFVIRFTVSWICTKYHAKRV